MNGSKCTGNAAKSLLSYFPYSLLGCKSVDSKSFLSSIIWNQNKPATNGAFSSIGNGSTLAEEPFSNCISLIFKQKRQEFKQQSSRQCWRGHSGNCLLPELKHQPSPNNLVTDDKLKKEGESSSASMFYFMSMKRRQWRVSPTLHVCQLDEITRCRSEKSTRVPTKHNCG